MLKFKKFKAKTVLNMYEYRDNWRAREFLNIGKSEKPERLKTEW